VESTESFIETRLTIPEAARAVKASSQFIRNEIARGNLRAERAGGGHDSYSGFRYRGVASASPCKHPGRLSRSPAKWPSPMRPTSERPTAWGEAAEEPGGSEDGPGVREVRGGTPAMTVTTVVGKATRDTSSKQAPAPEVFKVSRSLDAFTEEGLERVLGHSRDDWTEKRRSI